MFQYMNIQNVTYLYSTCKALALIPSMGQLWLLDIAEPTGQRH